MAPTRTIIAGNILVDVFVDAKAYALPEGAGGPVHRPFEELESILAKLGIGGRDDTAPGVTVRAGGAAGNAARILAEQGYRSTLFGSLGDDLLAERYRSILWGDLYSSLVEERLQVIKGSTTGVSITWYNLFGNGRPSSLVSPPPISPPLFWEELLSRLSTNTLFYLDGYAIPSFLKGRLSGPADRLAESGALLLIDLAHPAVTDACGAQLVSLLRQLASAGTEPTIFASAEELAPMGGVAAMAKAVKGGTVMIVVKEPPVGATVYRLHDEEVKLVARHRGESVKPIEITGLGDAFVAGWIATLLDGTTSPKGCAERAHDVARLCAANVGGTIAAGEATPNR